MKKKLIAALCAAMLCTLSVSAGEVMVGFWFNAPKDIGSTSVDGVRFGIPLSGGKYLDGAELSLIGSATKTVKGFQGTLFGFTRADVIQGCQVSFVNLALKNVQKTLVQVGAYNQTSNGGIQIGFINNGKDRAKIQVGLVNINEGGLLPVMIFFNCSK